MSPTQQEQLLSVGAHLQGIRKDQDKTIDEVANQIFIRPALVRAIEAGDWEALPEPVFVQGFIRRYADHLGLDGIEISKQFKPAPVTVLPTPALDRRNGVNGSVTSHGVQDLPVMSEPSAPIVDNTANVSSYGTSSLDTWKWLVGLLAIAALIGGGIWLGIRGTPRTANDTDDATVVTSVDASDAATEPASDQADPDGDSAATVAASATADGEATSEPIEAASSDSAPINFEVSLEDDAWMEVFADGESVYEGILTAGSQEAWTAQSELRVISGNSGAVRYTFNGSDEAPLGEPGSVQRRTFTPDMNPDALQSE